MIIVLQNENTGLQSAALAGQVIAADALFNGRVAELKLSKKPIDQERFLEILESYESLHESCQAAFEKSLLEKRYDNFEQVLASVRQWLDQEPMSTLRLDS